jgi:hypothetical protein
MKKSSVPLQTPLLQISTTIKKVHDGRKVAMIDGMLHGCKT